MRYFTVTVVPLFLLTLAACSQESRTLLPGDGTEEPSIPAAPFASLKVTATQGWTTPSGATTVTLDRAVELGEVVTCRFGHVPEVDAKPFTSCVGEGAQAFALSSLASNSIQGAHRLDLRYYDANTTTDAEPTASQSFEVYMHASLNGAATCDDGLSAEAVFTAARTYLPPSSNVFGSETSLKNPRAKLQWASAAINEVRSLRREFVMSDEKDIVWLRRRFTSSSLGGCSAMRLQRHTCGTPTPGELLGDGSTPALCGGSNSGPYNQTCDVVVMNADGKAACLVKSGSTLTLAGIFSIVRKFPESFDDDAANCDFEAPKGNSAFTKKTVAGACAHAVDHPYARMIYLPE